MDTRVLAQQIETDPPKTLPKHVIMERIKPYKTSLVGLSRFVWGYFGYAGLITPWHDNPEDSLRFSGSVVPNFLDYLDNEDLSLESYASFVFPIVPYERYNRIGRLLFNKGERAWMPKLRKYANSLNELDYAADLLLKFFQLQVEYFYKAEIKKASVVAYDPNTKKSYYFEGYHRLLDRIRQLKSLDIDPEVWLDEKFLIAKNAFPDSTVLFRTIVNTNGLDPDANELRYKSLDGWRTLRNFLGLSSGCEFVDGHIPKGWLPASDDRDELKKVIRIDGDGYYYYADGTQRRGKRHYSGNKYFVIKCTPDNFDLFKEEWFDQRKLVDRPTWDEYIKWSAYPGIWDASGNTISGRGRSVKWRKK